MLGPGKQGETMMTNMQEEALNLASSEYSRLISSESTVVNKCQSCLIVIAGQSIWLLSNLQFYHWLPCLTFILFLLTVTFDFFAIKNIKRGEIALDDYTMIAQMSKQDFGMLLLREYEFLIAEMRSIVSFRKTCFNLTFLGICLTFLGLLLSATVI